MSSEEIIIRKVRKISEFIPTGCIIKPMSPAGGISSIVNSSSLKLHYVEVSVMPSVEKSHDLLSCSE